MSTMAETEAAISQSYLAAHQEWRDKAEQMARMYAEYGDDFTSGDIAVAMEDNYPHLKTHSPLALGGIIRKLAGEGLIEKAGYFVPRPDRPNHRRPMQVWRGKK